MTTITTAETDDLDVLVDLWVALVEDQQHHGTHLRAAANSGVARDVVSQYVVADDLLVAREDDAILGFVMFHVEAGLYEQAVVRGIVDNLYVVPEARGRGIGSRLLDAAEAALVEDGADVVALSVMAANDRAIDFYERRGYAPHRLLLEKATESDNETRPDG